MGFGFCMASMSISPIVNGTLASLTKNQLEL
jgi:hypothetical protein